MSITTIGRWLDLPLARAAADEPLGSGFMQVAASNATHAARENNLRALWEHPGSANIYKDLPSGGLDGFDWDTEESAGRFTAFCGIHRVRRYGERIAWPRLELWFRGLAPSPYDLGVVVVAMPAPGQPHTRALFGQLTTSVTSLTTLKVTVPLDTSGMGIQRIQPRAGTGTITTLDEDGVVPSVAVYVGAWCTSGGSGAKAEMRGLTLFLREPA